MARESTQVEYPLPYLQTEAATSSVLLATSDFDGNGKTDLAVVSEFRDDYVLSVMYNKTVNACYPLP